MLFSEVNRIERRVVQHGPSTLIVSLPSRWVKAYGVKKGDELHVEEKGKNLVITSSAALPNLSLATDVSGLPSFLVTRLLARSYQKGYDKIRLTHNSPELLKAIQEKVQELIGYEIIEQDGKTCLVRSITSNIELGFDQSLRRAFLIVQQMLETCREAYAQGDKDGLNGLGIKDFEVNRLCYFCLRHMNKRGYVDMDNMHQSHVLYYLVEVLEDLGDSYKRLAALLAQSGRVNKRLEECLDLLQQQAKVSYEYFYAPTLQKAKDAYTLYKRLGEKLEEISQHDLVPQEVLAMQWIRGGMDIIYHFTTMRLDFLE